MYICKKCQVHIEQTRRTHQCACIYYYYYLEKKVRERVVFEVKWIDYFLRIIRSVMTVDRSLC